MIKNRAPEKRDEVEFFGKEEELTEKAKFCDKQNEAKRSDSDDV